MAAAQVRLADLEQLCILRLDEAQDLRTADKFQGAMYLTGYSVELALKAKISRTLGWTKYPASSTGMSNFAVHDFPILLLLSGAELEIKTHLMAEWSLLCRWTPTWRYQHNTGFNAGSVDQHISAARRIVTALGVV